MVVTKHVLLTAFMKHVLDCIVLWSLYQEALGQLCLTQMAY